MAARFTVGQKLTIAGLKHQVTFVRQNRGMIVATVHKTENGFRAGNNYEFATFDII